MPTDVRRKAVLYARVSSAEQEREGFSIPAQQRLLHEYAAKNDFHIVQGFVDVETAKQAGRTNFTQMLAYLAEMLSVTVVLVEKTDRLYRNFRDYVTIDDLDLEIHLVKEGEVLSRDSRSHQKFIHGIKVLMAKNYIDNLSEETRKGTAEKAESGVFPHRAPVRYRNDTDTRTIVVDSHRADYVRQLFEAYATGRYSMEDLHQRCIRDGFNLLGSKARTIPRSKVEYLLKNPLYTVGFGGRSGCTRVRTNRLLVANSTIESKKPSRHTGEIEVNTASTNSHSADFSVVANAVTR